MKTRILLSTTVFFLCSIILQAQTTTVPDSDFEQVLVDLGIDSDLTINQSVATCDISGVITLDVSSKNITDLTGIEGFISLTNLTCQSNQLISLDVTKNTALERLSCGANLLTSLDVTQNTYLDELRCHGNQLTSLDVTENTALERLVCLSNQLTSLDVTRNIKLGHLRCEHNQLTSLDVTQNTKLAELRCSGNRLTSLDVSQNTALEMFECYSNKLTSLDVSQNTALVRLICADNKLTSLDATQNTALEWLVCQTNQLTSLDVSLNTALTYLSCYSNLLTSFDVTQNTALGYLSCNHNQLTSFDVRNGNNSLIWYFNATDNPSLTCIYVDDEAADHSAWQVDPGVALSNDCMCNLPPVAVCQNVTVDADQNGEAIVTASQVDNSSYDPDGDPITLSLDPLGPYPLGETTVTLTVLDDNGASDQCTATITVVDDTPPVITTIADPITLWPPNHKYASFSLRDFVLSVSDNCAILLVDDVVMSKVTSDEPVDANGGGDGNTTDDIIISNDCKSIQVREERQGSGNGRVYTVYLDLDDGNGNTASTTCQVQVPHTKGETAIDDGAVYEVLGDCGN